MKKIKYYKDDEITMSSLIEDECGTENEGYRPDNVMLCYYNDLLFNIKRENNLNNIVIVHSDNVCSLNEFNEFMKQLVPVRTETFRYMNFMQTYHIAKIRGTDSLCAVEYTEGNTGIYIDKKYTEVI